MPAPELPRRPLSPWPIGAATLAIFVALAAIFRDSYAALQVMFAVSLIIGLALAWTRRPTRPSSKTLRTAGETPRGQPSPSPAATAPDLPPVVKADQAADYLGVTVAEVIQEIQDGRMPGNQLGQHWLIRREALFTWLDGPYARDTRPTA